MPHGDKEDQEDKENSGMAARTAVGIAVLALLLSVAAFILIVLLWVDPNISPMSRKANAGGGGGGAAGPGGSQSSNGMAPGMAAAVDNHIYLFTMGTDFLPFNYVNDEGKEEGFMPSFLEEACKHAKKRCKVMISPYSLDYDAKIQYGPGLSGKFFDASSGWANTVERKGVYDFSGKFANTPDIYLYKKAGASVSLTASSKVGFREFYYSSASCLKKSQNAFDKTKAMNYADWTAVAAKLADGTVDLAFAPEGSLGAGVEKVGSAMKCGELFGFMHRKDVEMKWLDEALAAMKKDGSFKNLCDQSWKGKKVPCA